MKAKSPGEFQNSVLSFQTCQSSYWLYEVSVNILHVSVVLLVVTSPLAL